MYAVIEACGKQYKVTKGDVVFFEKLEAEEGKKVTFDKVVLLSDEGKIEVGAPYVKGIKVEGKVATIAVKDLTYGNETTVTVGNPAHTATVKIPQVSELYILEVTTDVPNDTI